MTAAEIAETLVGGVAPHLQKSGQGLKCIAYTLTKAATADWAILDDFTVVKEVVAYTVSAGARTAEPFTIDATTTNKVIFSSATTGTVSFLAWGY